MAILRVAATISTPNDTAVNTYLDCGAGLISYAGGALSIQLFYALNTHTTSSNVISVANSGAATMEVIAVEWTGAATSSPVDGTNKTANGSTGTGGGQNMTGGAVVTAQSGSLVVGFGADADASTITAGTGFTIMLSGSPFLEYQIQATAGSIAATWNSNINSNPYGAITAVFKVPRPPGFDLTPGRDCNPRERTEVIGY